MTGEIVIPELASGICFNLVGTIDCRAPPSNDVRESSHSNDVWRVRSAMTGEIVIPELVSGICFNLVCTIDCRASHSNDVRESSLRNDRGNRHSRTCFGNLSLFRHSRTCFGNLFQLGMLNRLPGSAQQ